MKYKAKKVYQFHAVNLVFFIIGELIIWFATHSLLGLFGGLVAAMHFEISADDLTSEL